MKGAVIFLLLHQEPYVLVPMDDLWQSLSSVQLWLFREPLCCSTVSLLRVSSPVNMTSCIHRAACPCVASPCTDMPAFLPNAYSCSGRRMGLSTRDEYATARVIRGRRPTRHDRTSQLAVLDQVLRHCRIVLLRAARTAADEQVRTDGQTHKCADTAGWG